MAGTRERLVAGAIEAIRQHGISGVSARTIATVAGVNQALVFYHFGSVHELLGEACRSATTAIVAEYREPLAEVATFRELLVLGRRLHREESARGHVTVLAQLLAGAQTDPALADVTAAALGLWVAEIEAVLDRLLAGSPLGTVADAPGLARAVSAAFIGLELFEGVDAAGAEQALAALDRLAVLAEVVDELGPVAQGALRAKLGRAGAAGPA